MIPDLIAVDWGTSSLRCYLVSRDGTIIDQTISEQGILRTDNRAFADVLAENIFPWTGQIETSGKRCQFPLLMSGMIGSRQGWREAAYLSCPAGASEIACNLQTVDADNPALSRLAIKIVPGLNFASPTGMSDVMRGEETQIIGALKAINDRHGLFVLPGTHSKWAQVDNGAITQFRTYMTGEVFSALLDHTILGKLARTRDFSATGFAEGLDVAQRNQAGPDSTAGGLLNLVFSARTRVLNGDLSECATASYLSGILIGAEILSAKAAIGNKPPPVHIIADDPLRTRYRDAARVLGLDATALHDNCVVLAHIEIAGAGGLLL